jgi:uncharacterized protein (TIGR00251 family)
MTAHRRIRQTAVAKAAPSAQAAVTLRVRVTPRAGRDAIAGWQDGALRVRLAAPPLEGRANTALIRLLAAAAGLAPSNVRLLTGHRSRDKRLAFDGIDAAALHARLGIPHAPAP